jgi:hypothetical protein
MCGAAPSSDRHGVAHDQIITALHELPDTNLSIHFFRPEIRDIFAQGDWRLRLANVALEGPHPDEITRAALYKSTVFSITFSAWRGRSSKTLMMIFYGTSSLISKRFIASPRGKSRPAKPNTKICTAYAG